MLDSVYSLPTGGPGFAEPDPEAEAPNIGAACSDALCARGLGSRVALRWIPRGGERESITYAQLAAESSRFANVLAMLGYQPGESIFLCAPRQPAVCYAFLGALKARVVAGMLFSSFGEEALADRLGDACARGVLTRKSQLKKLQHLRPCLPALRHAIVVDLPDHESDFVLSFSRLMRESRSSYLPGRTTRATPSLLHYTSGSTGKPKGVVHGHGALAYLRQTARDVLDLRPDDVYWCTADPGWVTGTSYGMIGPWSLGVTQIQLGGNYDGAAWMCALEEEDVSVWYTAPTALRMLMREPPAVFESLRVPRLRYLASVGEPLNPEAIAWGRRTLGLDVHDTWFQTETGGILIANRADLPIRPGSMGKPVEGIEAAILDDQGAMLPDGEVGRLCIRRGWPSMFLGYLQQPEATAGKFTGAYYDSGDRAHRDADGYYWFAGRADDVINTAGHLVSPFEIESALLERPEVAESAAIAAPDDLLFERVVAFVVLRPGVQASTRLGVELRIAVSNRVSTYGAPRDIVFVSSLPKTKSGKIMRRLLRARYLGLPEGDLSSLED
jgi:acetyl-CoA synthetase